jgi:chromosome segregation ATPase
MSRDKEVSLGQIDDLSLGEGERRRQSGSAPQPSRERTAAAKSKPASSDARRPRSAVAQSQGSSFWMIAAGVLLILIVVLGAYFFRELQGMRAQLDSKLDQSSQMLGNLESQLSATDESLTQSSGKTGDMLKVHDSEIRKLWDVANKRNKESIQKNQNGISKLEKQRAELAKSVASLETVIAALQKQGQQYALQRNQMQTQIDLASESVRQAEQQVAGQKKVIDQIAKILPALKVLAAEQSKGEGLDFRMTEIEAAIGAFDAYRREVNTRLDRVESAAK